MKRPNKFSPLVFFIFTGFFLFSGSGCGPNFERNRAKAAEKKGRYEKAWTLYQKLAADYPQSKLAPEALFRAGWLVQKHLRDCYMARTFYDLVLERYPQSKPWAAWAAQQKNNCPDYFPLTAGFKWTIGDSDTAGQQARVEVVCKAIESNKVAISPQSGILSRTYFAGTSKFKEIQMVYKKSDTELMEFGSLNDPLYKVILKWPMEAGSRWATKWDKHTFLYQITDVDKTVKVVAGEFDHCLRVRSSIEGSPGATVEYYAPDVGRVLTTFETKDGEKRNIELISYTPAESSDFTETKDPS